jgi:Acetyl-CoA dehydrogenase C-terminal like/Acyl-CoA dehydrogenase, C-terminal domain
LRGRRRPDRVNDLLLPIVKGVGSERAYQCLTECLTESLQTLGGSGFLHDYPIEQYIRDAKIDSLYEGTTAIPAQDFFFRKIARDQGVALQHLLTQVRASWTAQTPGRNWPTRARRWPRTARHAGHGDGDDRVPGRVPAEHPRAIPGGLESVPFLLAVGDLLDGWLLRRHAEIALDALDRGPAGDELAFHSGKFAAAKFFAKNLLGSPGELPAIWVYSAMTDRLRRTDRGWRIVERHVGPTTMNDRLRPITCDPTYSDRYLPRALAQ